MNNINSELEATLRDRLAQSRTALQKFGFFERANTYRDYQNQLGFDDDAFTNLLDAFDIPESDIDKSHSNDTEVSINHALDILIKTKEYRNQNLSSVTLDHSLLCDDILCTWHYHYNSRSVEDDNNEPYTHILKQLARISDGIFTPTNITETWSNDYVDVAIQFQTNDDIWLVKINYGGEGYRGMQDITTIVNSANQSLVNQDLQFYMVKTFNHVLCITALTHSNKASLETERNWIFSDSH